MTPFEVAQAGFLLTLLNAGVAVLFFALVTFGLLRIADKISGLNFHRAINLIEDDPRAMTVYLSVRYAVLGLGNALILASVFLYS